MRLLAAALFLFISLILCPRLQAQQPTTEGLKAILRNNLEQLQLTRADVDEAIISNSHRDDQSGIQYVYLQQTWKKIKVFNRIITVALKDQAVVSRSGKFAERISSGGQAMPVFPAASAVMNAARHLALTTPTSLKLIEELPRENKIIYSSAGIAKNNIETELFWVVTADTIVRLAWNVNIDVRQSPDWWNVRVDARTGDIIEKDNWTVNEAPVNRDRKPEPTDEMNTTTLAKESDQPTIFQNQRPAPFLPPAVSDASYFVVPFPYQSPKHHALSLENKPWLKAGAGNPSGTHGWQFDGTTDYTITRGNNAFAYLDIGNTNASGAATNWPDTSTTALPSLTFNFPPNFNQQPEALANKRTAIANLFYWNNLMHDVFYQYGFTEAAGNFQADNIGRGGAGNDFVQAEGQDASGTSNANFSTPIDGQRPRMQMYLWSSTPSLVVNTPAVIAGTYPTLESTFSTNNKLADLGPITGQVIFFNDDAGGLLHSACSAAANSLTGKIALIDRGTCNFTVKVKNAQLAGAIAVIMVNNVAGGPIVMGGTDNTITIPAVMVSQANGALIAAQIIAGVTVTISGGIGFDGDLDNSIICHEYGHGISSRLTGGAANGSCLSNTEKGSEGWSDFMALMMVTDWGIATINDGTLPRTIGTYAANQPITGDGIRNYPYSTNLSINPLVYKTNMPSEVHDLGEHWCAALWEMTWEMIRLDGINQDIFNSSATGGNSAALKLVIEGMKLQPCNPGFIDARDAILKADTLFFNAHYSCAIWKAFAKRGMGRNALQGSSNSVFDQVPDFSIGTAQVTANPSNFSSCTGGTASFAVVASGSSLSYQWQVSSNGGGTFTDITGATAANLTLETVAAILNNNQYRVIVNGPCGSNAISTAAILSVSAGPAITAQPQPQTVCAAANVNFVVAVTGPVLGYQWQVSVDGGNNFSPITGATGATLTLNAVTAAMNNNQYRAVINASCGSGLNSTAAKLTVNSSAAITADPLNAGACNGANVNFIVAGTGTTLGYQWQLSTDGGASFNNIAGATSATLSLNSVSFSMGNNQYRSVITSACVAATSAAATLTVFSPPVITGQPADQVTCESSNVSFSVTATGSVTGYQWQVSTDGGTLFSDLNGAVSSTLLVSSVGLAQEGNLYRAVIIGNCSSVNSTAASLTVRAQPVFTLDNIPSVFCLSDTTFNLSASLGGGFWNGPGVQVSQFSAATAGLGSHTVSYAVTNDLGCTLVLSSVVQVNECPERHVGLDAPGALIVYPNPNNGNFRVRLHTDLYSNLGMKVYTSDGKYIKTMSFTGISYDQFVQINLTTLQNGLYFLYFYDPTNTSKARRTVGVVVNR